MRAITAAAATLAAGGTLAGLPSAASAAFVEPPPLPHEVIVFPDRDFVSAEGFGPGEPLTIRVIRNGVTIGTASGITDPSGLLEVNHPGGVCWQGSTPDIMAHDKVVTAPTSSAEDVGEALTASDVVATAAERDATGRVIVRFTARNADGSPIDIANIEQRIINPALVDTEVGRRDVRAVPGDSTGGGLLSPDPNVPGGFIAVYDQYPDEVDDLIIAGQTRVLTWQATNAAGDRLGITIHEVGEVGGPGFGGCPLGAEYAVTSTSQPAVTKAMVDAGAPLVLSGVSENATAASVTLSDSDPATPDVTVDASTPTPGTGAQTWSATFAPAAVAGLTDGTLTATGSYTVNGTPIGGRPKTIAKDTIAPGAPDATPGPGTYATAQAVTLQGADPDAVIHYTANGTAPTAAGPVAPAQLLITSTQTIRAVAIDPVGNPSPESTFAYTIAPAAPGGSGGGSGAPAGGGGGAAPAAGGGLGTIVPILGPQTRPGTVATPGAAPRLAIRGLSMARRISVARLRSRGLRAVMRVPAGTTVVRFALYRADRSGRRTGRALARGTRRTATGTVRLRLRDRALLRRLKAGRYVLELRPGRSAADTSGRTSRARLTVVR